MYKFCLLLLLSSSLSLALLTLIVAVLILVECVYSDHTILSTEASYTVNYSCTFYVLHCQYTNVSHVWQDNFIKVKLKTI
jgi:hypothetical protein